MANADASLGSLLVRLQSPTTTTSTKVQAEPGHAKDETPVQFAMRYGVQMLVKCNWLIDHCCSKYHVEQLYGMMTWNPFPEKDNYTIHIAGVFLV